jgi:hypothetical protein
MHMAVVVAWDYHNSSGLDWCSSISGAHVDVAAAVLQVSLANTLVQWPYLADLGLVAAIINVFYAVWGAAPKLPPAWLQLRRNPWLYFNLVITDSQVCCSA